jgi:hypothetical protein
MLLMLHNAVNDTGRFVLAVVLRATSRLSRLTLAMHWSM